MVSAGRSWGLVTAMVTACGSRYQLWLPDALSLGLVAAPAAGGGSLAGLRASLGARYIAMGAPVAAVMSPYFSVKGRCVATGGGIRTPWRDKLPGSRQAGPRAACESASRPLGRIRRPVGIQSADPAEPQAAVGFTLV